MDPVVEKVLSESCALPCQPASVAAARHLVRAVLGDLPLETVEATELMVSELATNCVTHAGTDFELTIDRSPSQIRVGISDSVRTPPVLRHVGPRALSGRGLQIVESMADAWGVSTGAEGKTVWFTLSAVAGRRELRG
jgi:anti-sigma regulatory factor (Ser/Thr protein kinase)